MVKTVPFVAVVLVLALLALACDGDGGPATVSPAIRPNSGETATAEPTETPGQELSPGATVEETPTSETASPAPTPTLPPEATPVIGGVDPAQYVTPNAIPEECAYDPRTAIANCGDRGIFATVPPFFGEDISCSVFIDQGEPVLLLCSSQEPQRAVYYAIEG